MPLEMRQLGDAYVRAEFKLHKSVTGKAQLDAFFDGWENYLDQILTSARQRETMATGVLDEKLVEENVGFGRELPAGTEFSEEQMLQLEKLKEEASRTK